MNALQAEIQAALKPLEDKIARLTDIIAAKDEDTLLTVEDAAKRLKLSEATIRKHVREGKMKTAPRSGRRIMFKPEHIERFGG